MSDFKNIAQDAAEALFTFYDYSKIPIWQLDASQNLILCAGYEPLSGVMKGLSGFFEHLISRCSDPNYDILEFENELYGIFTVGQEDSIQYYICGPALLSHSYSHLELHGLSFSERIPSNVVKDIAEHLPVVTLSKFLCGIRLLMLLLGKKPPASNPVSDSFQSPDTHASSSILLQELFENQEESWEHTPFSHEMALLECVQSGNLLRLEKMYYSLPETKYGKMSTQPLKSLFYGSIANTTLITRYAIMGGMDEETAFSLSDLYIRKMEQCQSVQELHKINERMGLDFTARVAESKKEDRHYSHTITECLHYITNNTHKRIDLRSTAQALNVSPKYLSYLFKKETGQSFQKYVMEQKITEAKALLTLSEYSSSEIGEYLGFCSQSHFISVFKQYTGKTPLEYKAANT